MNFILILFAKRVGFLLALMDPKIFGSDRPHDARKMGSKPGTILVCPVGQDQSVGRLQGDRGGDAGLFCCLTMMQIYSTIKPRGGKEAFYPGPSLTIDAKRVMKWNLWS